MSVAPTSPSGIHEPPKNLNAERTVLGACLIDNSTIDIVLDILSANIFYPTAHQEIFGAIKALHADHLPVDVISVAEHLDRHGKLDVVGGAAYLAGFREHVLTTQNIEHYCLLVRDAWQRRELIQASHEIVEDCHNAGLENKELLSVTEARLKRITLAKERGGLVHISEIGYEELGNIERRSCGEVNPSPPVFSGIRSLDEITGGAFGGELWMIAARPGQGKTELGFNIAAHVARKGAVAAFSLEMSAKALHHRLVAAESVTSQLQGIPAKCMRHGFTEKTLLSVATEVNERVCATGLWIDDTPRLRIDTLCTRARRLASDGNLKMVLVDYVQLLRHPDRRLSKVEQIDDNCAELKALAGELNVPVVALAQNNRDQAKRGKGARAELSDLKGSGALEQDPDVVIFIEREQKDEDDANMAAHLKGTLAMLNVAKARNGETGHAPVLIIDEYTWIGDRP